MGVSNNAKLYFGFPIGEEDEKPEFMGEYEDFEEFIEARAGLDYSADGYEKCMAAREACPVELFMHCSYDFSMYVLGIRGAEYNAYRGELTEITPEMLAVAPEKIAAFKTWCEEIGIAWQEPKWWLCSLNG